MATASIAELKAKLSAYLDVVKAGEEVVVTERGHAIARVVPFTRSGPTPAEHEEMLRTGQIRPPRKRVPRDFWRRPLPVVPAGAAVRAVLAEREDGW
jgi:prevent-host-death family protein